MQDPGPNTSRSPLTATGLLDVARVSDLLARIKHHITHKPLDRVSPLAVPVMLELGRERIEGEARDEVFEAAMVAEMFGWG